VTPAWWPALNRAAALVTDAGRERSHAALLGREYGIPVVMGTGDATARIHPGQMITVDGSAGAVYLDAAAGALPWDQSATVAFRRPVLIGGLSIMVAAGALLALRRLARR
jgi:phosphoenolpyruvate synthase/pyruvate phosphate dikinase